MGRKKRGRKVRMKNRQLKRSMKILLKDYRLGQQYLIWQCFINGHEYRDLPDIGRICIRCGDEPEL